MLFETPPYSYFVHDQPKRTETVFSSSLFDWNIQHQDTRKPAGVFVELWQLSRVAEYSTNASEYDGFTNSCRPCNLTRRIKLLIGSAYTTRPCIHNRVPVMDTSRRSSHHKRKVLGEKARHRYKYFSNHEWCRASDNLSRLLNSPRGVAWTIFLKKRPSIFPIFRGVMPKLRNERNYNFLNFFLNRGFFLSLMNNLKTTHAN